MQQLSRFNVRRQLHFERRLGLLLRDDVVFQSEIIDETDGRDGDGTIVFAPRCGDLDFKAAVARRFDPVRLDAEREAGLERLNLDAIQEIGPGLAIQFFDKQTVCAVLAELVRKRAFVCAGDIGLAQLLAIGVEEAHEQIARRTEAASPAGENQALVLGGREFKPVAVFWSGKAPVDNRGN